MWCGVYGAGQEYDCDLQTFFIIFGFVRVLCVPMQFIYTKSHEAFMHPKFQFHIAFTTYKAFHADYVVWVAISGVDATPA